MFRLVRSALRTADRLIQAHSSSPAIKLKQPLNNLIHNLTGVASHTKVSGSRGLSNSSLAYNIPRYAHQSPPFKTTLSLPARIALGRPLSAPFLPRTPTLPRSVTQVGLGTARNFSSTRHVFQNLVENVPVSARAWYEADWEVKSGKGRSRRSVVRKQSKKAKAVKIADKSKAREEVGLGASSDTSVTLSSTFEEEFSRYFATAIPTEHAEGTTTYLTIPLHPAVERVPLPSVTNSSSGLLPLSELRDIHGDYSLHAIRVSSLFSRLDTGDVWSRGVECECYGGSTEPSAPSALQIVFKGWSKEMVLDVIGEAGKGWCELEEERPPAPPADPVAPSALTSTPVMAASDPVDPMAMTFIIPNLDFSSSFLTHRSTALDNDPRPVTPPFSDWTTPFSTSPPSPSLTAVTDETFGYNGSEENSDSDEDDFGSLGSESSLGFSVDFLSRGETIPSPRAWPL